jgi:hypothetical protein
MKIEKLYAERCERDSKRSPTRENGMSLLRSPQHSSPVENEVMSPDHPRNPQPPHQSRDRLPQMMQASHPQRDEGVRVAQQAKLNGHLPSPRRISPHRLSALDNRSAGPSPVPGPVRTNTNRMSTNDARHHPYGAGGGLAGHTLSQSRQAKHQQQQTAARQFMPQQATYQSSRPLMMNRPSASTPATSVYDPDPVRTPAVSGQTRSSYFSGGPASAFRPAPHYAQQAQKPVQQPQQQPARPRTQQPQHSAYGQPSAGGGGFGYSGSVTGQRNDIDLRSAATEIN